MMQNTVLVPGLSGKDFSAGCESWCSFQQTDAGQMPQIDDSGISIYFLGGFLIDEFTSSTKLLLLWYLQWSLVRFCAGPSPHVRKRCGEPLSAALEP